jgi:hypothetical protein
LFSPAKRAYASLFGRSFRHDKGFLIVAVLSGYVQIKEEK